MIAPGHEVEWQMLFVDEEVFEDHWALLGNIIHIIHIVDIIHIIELF